MPEHRTKGGHASADIPANALGPLPEVLTKPAMGAHATLPADQIVTAPFDLDAWMARMNDPNTPKATWDGEQWQYTGQPGPNWTEPTVTQRQEGASDG